MTEDGKVSLHCFSADHKIVSAWKKIVLWHCIESTHCDTG